jgi:hypothetical protein
MRIELRQIGVRDETKILGGIGICGRALCCHSYLTDFAPVSIKMAKEQNLSLNPTKISGVCGRLMCCLKNEEETYEYLNSQLPVVGETVTTKDGSVTGEVASISVLRQKVKVIITIDDEKEIREFDAADLKFRPRRRKGKDEPSGKKGGKGRKGQDGREPWQSAAGEEMQDPDIMDEESWDDVPAESAEPEDEYAAVGESAGEAASGQDPEDEAREKNRRRNESRRNRRKRSERKEKEAGEAREGVSAQQQRERAGEDRETDFINIIAWRGTAEFVSKYFTKGQLVAVCGKLQVRSWEDTSGQKRYATDVVADEVFFAESKKTVPAQTVVQEEGNLQGFTSADEDLPF